MKKDFQPLTSNPFPEASKYGTFVMKDDEVLLFTEVALENADSAEEAINDMKMIDSLLYAKRLHLQVHGHIKYTKGGSLRKGTSLYNTMEQIITGRLEQE